MTRSSLIGLALTLACTLTLAQPATPNIRLRGSIERVDASTLVLKERGGDSRTLVIADNMSVSEVLPIDPSALQSGTFIGTAAVPGPDGSLSALEVLVFPEAARGTGEGHSAWDLQPGATMTNATVSAVTPTSGGKTITLRYKDGEKIVRIPDGVPIVTVKPADRSLLVPGAKVFVTAQMRDGKLTALRVTAGRDGFAPPM